MSVAAGLLFFALVQSSDSIVIAGSVNTPAISTDGRLAFSRDGDLWMVSTSDANGELRISGPLIQLTTGPTWDREPAWAPDGSRLVYSSNGGGDFQLWEIEIGANGTTRGPVQLTTGTDQDAHPTVAADGSIVFVRGERDEANLWRRATDATEEALTTRVGMETLPRMSPNGSDVLYVQVVDQRRQLRVLSLETQLSKTIIANAQVASASWSPDGQQIAFVTQVGQVGVWVTPADGRFRNLVSENAAAPVWAPGGRHLLLAELPATGPSYNGDPVRIADRAVNSDDTDGRVWVIAVPEESIPVATEIAIETSSDRPTHNANEFDRVWNRISDLYFPSGNPAWSSMRQEFRTRAVAASTDSVLDDVIHELLVRRPTARKEATGRAGVSSAHPLATAAGLEILDAGGNVVDAAVAVSFALGVVEPDASGIGGYGEMVVYTTDMEAPVVLEFLTRVPEHASLDNAALVGDRLPRDGPVLANVPGTVAGMHEAWKRFGSGNVSWARLVEPAIRLARDGFELDDAFTSTLIVERERFLQYESSKNLFFPNGEPLVAGDTFENPDLAWTLTQIAEGGADGFYRGEVARRLVQDLRGQGNAITATDLSRYFAVLREPVVGTYRGHTIYSGAPAVSGGVSLVAKLHHLQYANRIGNYRDEPRALHAMIEAWKLAPSTGGRVADPSLWPVDYEPIINSDSARTRWEKCYRENKSSGPQELNRMAGNRLSCMEREIASSWGEEGLSCDPNVSSCRSTGTTAFAVADADGNMVAVTQTLGTWGGNFYVTPGLGFLYNDKLRSYSSNPNSYNARIPFARNSTSIAPTLVFRGTGESQTPLLALGAAGNAWITAAVYQVLSGIVDGGLGPQRALELPRFLVGVRRSGSEVREIVVQTEDGFSPNVMRQLESMGHQFQPISLRGELRMGYGAAVLRDGNRVRAGADPRRSGHAGAIN